MPETPHDNPSAMVAWLRGHEEIDATDDYLWFGTDECPTCKRVPLAITLQHCRYTSSGSDLQGKIVAQCSRCSKEWVLQDWRRGPDEMPQRVEQPTCRCGHRYFYVMACNRFEEDGFPDESICWGQCAKCGRCQIIARSD